MTNKLFLFNKKPKNYPILTILFFMMMIILTSYTILSKAYDVWNVTGIISCNELCEISVTLPYDKIEILEYEDVFITFLDNNYKIINVLYEEPYLNNGTPYQDVKIVTDLESEDKIINFKILYNKQRIIYKIKNIVLER